MDARSSTEQESHTEQLKQGASMFFSSDRRQFGLRHKRVLLTLGIGTLIAVPFWPSSAAGGQSAGVNQAGSEYIHAPAGLNPMPAGSHSQEATRVEQMRLAERHKRIAADTARLVELSGQLKSELDHASDDRLSVEALRKAGDIEKTAHDLKQWMAN